MFCLELSGFKLVGHVLETLAVDEYICGQRCLRNEKCLSYNSHSDDDHDNNKCELSDQNRPDKLIRRPGFTYHIKGKHKLKVLQWILLRQIISHKSYFEKGCQKVLRVVLNSLFFKEI